MHAARLAAPRPHAPTRREFTTLAAGGLAALAAPGCARPPAGGTIAIPAGPLVAPPACAPGAPAPVALVGVPRGADTSVVAAAVRRAALAIDDLGWLSRGDSVLLKVVCNSGNPYPATTDPVAVRAMTELLLERGAGRVVVADMSGVQAVRFWKDGLRGSSRVLMARNGLSRAAGEAGAEVHAFEEAGWDGFYEERPTVAGTWAGPVMLPNVLREVDHVVLMPRCGRHVLAGSTLGLKAAVGWWRHDSRLEYHRDASTFAEKTADASSVPTMLAKQRLVLTSATRVLTTFGPDQGFVHEPETGLVIASASVVAHDMVSLAWLVESRQATPARARDGFMADPNRSPAFVNLANRIVTTWLGGVRDMLRTEHLAPWTLDTVWDDRVLRRAFATGGGVPRVELGADAAGIPDELRRRLVAAVTPA